MDSTNRIKFSGLMYGDYFYNFNSIDGKQIHGNDFDFRRIYFTADIIVAENFDARFRLDADQNINADTLDVGFDVFVKDAYIKWKGIFTGSDMLFGISPTPAFDISEAAWSYRSLEKTIMDLNSIVPSRDLGADLRGKIINNGSINYWIKVGNNTSSRQETDRNHKRFYALLQIKPAKGFQTTIYYDYAIKPEVIDPFDKTYKANNAHVAAIFLNYQQNNNFALGFEGFTRVIQNGYSPNAISVFHNQSSIGYSGWVWAKLSERFKGVARYDNFDPNTDKSNNAINFYLFGIEYIAAKNVSVIPNIEITNFQSPLNINGSTSNSNITGRLTFAFAFN